MALKASIAAAKSRATAESCSARRATPPGSGLRPRLRIMASDRDRDRAQWTEWRDRVYAERETLENVERNLASPPKPASDDSDVTDPHTARQTLASVAHRLNESSHALAALAREMEEFRREHFYE